MNRATIGPYQILRELGRGGMGEVYLARDARLDRQVAIKALPAHLSTDPDRLARFQREAKVLASLNHPGVGAIYGLEEADGHQYLVLEFIEGETLADRLVSGAVPVDESLTIAKQIAEALEVAHEKGVVHRDLKPGNVMVTETGVVKVLDFGLARTAEGSPSTTNSPGVSPVSPVSPTLTSPAPVHSPTIPGAIMGTAGYMSPEQARGKAVDKRSDIFSFGCILYEMLTGRGPFPGETVTDSLGAILHRDPDWNLIPPSTPARLRELLRNCLAKDRRSRLHDIGDARLEIERTISGQEWTTSTPAAPAGKPNWMASLSAACAIALLAAAASWLLARTMMRPSPVAPAQTFYAATPVPPKPELGALIGIAHDARFVVYRANPELERDSMKPPGVLVVRRLDRDETKIIEGTEGAMEGALSPDGRFVAFSASKDRARSKTILKKIGLDNGRPIGTPETLCDLPAGGSPLLCWSSDREIIMALSWEQTILAVSAAGGEPRVVLHEERSKEIDNWGDVRPLVDGRSILATRWSLVGQSVKERTEVVDVTSGKRTPLLQNAGAMQYLPGGYVVARRNQNSLIASQFDLETLQLVGEPATIWSGKVIDSFRVSPSGTLAMVTRSGDLSGRKLAWIDEQGLAQSAGAPPRAYGEIMVAPDGGRVAVNMDTTDQTELPTDLWLHDLTRRTLTRLPTQGPCWQFIWSGDSQRIAYGTVTKDEFSVWERHADGAGEASKVYSSGAAQILTLPTDWSPDGRSLAIVRVDLSKEAADVLIAEREQGSQQWTAKPYLNSSANEDALRFSPDGKLVRFATDESGRREMYVQRFTGAGSGAEDAKAGRVQISTGGAEGFGWWSPDSKEIRYVDTDGQVVSVQLRTEPSISASLPKVLYSIKDLKTRSRSFAPDGRLMAVLEGENERASRIDLIINILDELRAKVAAAK